MEAKLALETEEERWFGSELSESLAIIDSALLANLSPVALLQLRDCGLLSYHYRLLPCAKVSLPLSFLNIRSCHLALTRFCALLRPDVRCPAALANGALFQACSYAEPFTRQ